MNRLVLFVGLLCLASATARSAAPEQGPGAARMATEKLKTLHEDRLRFARERRSLPDLTLYQDFKAVLHVHAEDSDHTKGTREEVLAAAKKTGISIVMLSDHRGPRPETWHGLRDGVMFLAGSEDGDNVLRLPHFDTNRLALPKGELRFMSHVEDHYDREPDGFAGLEICNRHTDAKLDQSVEAYLKAAAGNPEAWRTVVENFKNYPDEMFAAGTDHHPKIFATWDRISAERPFTGIAANDAHQNQVFQGVTFDPYEVSFRNLSTHVLARELSEPDVRQALQEGHVYVAHDWLCDPSGFAFGAYNNMGAFPMGDKVLLWDKTRVIGFTPLAAKLKLFYNGSLIHETNGTNLTYHAALPGTYRLEAWLHAGGEDRPWIYSNPVYLEKASLASSLSSLPWPVMDPAAPVVEKKDVVYVKGKPEDEGKHKLDLYVPRDKKQTPVFIFFHGGAWRTGDRALYPALGYRFAKEGILTVVPSYRLAPKNKHPAQLEDAASAFAWVMEHITAEGGDTNRIYVGGHSAGGHICALLALDDHWLKTYGLSPKNIRGVIPMSGVFDLTSIGTSQSPVFGLDPDFRRSASPLYHITRMAPPFLITCCQWDYVPLAAQARQFWNALRNEGIKAQFHFTPKESHISEVFALTHDDDLTAKALLGFMQ